MMKLGKSQKSVYDLLMLDGPSPAQFVGDQLYEKVSSCFMGKDANNGGYGMGGTASPEEIRRNWASKILNELKKKGFVDFRKQGNTKVWYVTEDGTEA